MRDARRAAIGALLASLMTSLVAGACARPETGADADTLASSGASAGEVSTASAAGTVGTVDAGTLVGVGAPDLAALSPPDVMAIIGAANAGEISTSRVGLQRSTSRDVRAFARRMIDAHQALQAEADRVAERMEVVPGDPAPAVERTRAAVELRRQLDTATTGPAFDRRFLDAQLQAHQQMLAELQAMQRTGQPELRRLIRGAIPQVEAHLRETQRLLGRLGPARGATTDTNVRNRQDRGA